jgi:hypothetical protein
MSQSPSNPDPREPLDFPGFPPTDETGDVDLELLAYNLSLTPAERLRRLESFVNFLVDSWRRNGIRPDDERGQILIDG